MMTQMQNDCTFEYLTKIIKITDKFFSIFCLTVLAVLTFLWTYLSEESNPLCLQPRNLPSGLSQTAQGELTPLPEGEEGNTVRQNAEFAS